MTVTNSPNNRPDLDAIRPPMGPEVDDWQHENGHAYRIIYGETRRIAGRADIFVQPTAVQLGDGSTDDGSVIEGPVVHVDGVSGVPLTVAQARQFAAVVMAAADSLAALSPDPADPLDGVSLARLLDEIAKRVREANAR
jgi:hypothetical protein